MIWYIYIFISLGFKSTDPRTALSKWLLLLRYEGYQGLHNGVGSHCPAQLSPSAEFKLRTFESHCTNIPIWKKKNYMKIKNLIVVFSSGVYLAVNSNAPKIVFLSPPPHPHPPFCWRSSFCIKNKSKSEIFKDKKSL